MTTLRTKTSRPVWSNEKPKIVSQVSELTNLGFFLVFTLGLAMIGTAITQ